MNIGNTAGLLRNFTYGKYVFYSLKFLNQGGTEDRELYGYSSV